MTALTPISGYRLFADAIAIINDQSENNLTVQDVGAELNCSTRAIQYAFQSTLGVSPSQYLLARRLQRVRQDLLTGQRSSITDVAFHHGFNHLSRFAGHYLRMFGERPSETLRRAGTCRRPLVA